MTWKFRIFATRIVQVQSISTPNQITTIDQETQVPFTIAIPDDCSVESMRTGREYQVRLKVYTLQLQETSVVPELIEFFTVTDVDRSFDEFVKASFIDDALFRFELIDFDLVESNDP